MHSIKKMHHLFIWESHHITFFELAYGYEVAKKNGVIDCFSIEMLEGMSESARVALRS